MLIFYSYKYVCKGPIICIKQQYRCYGIFTNVIKVIYIPKHDIIS